MRRVDPGVLPAVTAVSLFAVSEAYLHYQSHTLGVLTTAIFRTVVMFLLVVAVISRHSPLPPLRDLSLPNLWLRAIFFSLSSFFVTGMLYYSADQSFSYALFFLHPIIAFAISFFVLNKPSIPSSEGFIAFLVMGIGIILFVISGSSHTTQIPLLFPRITSFLNDYLCLKNVKSTSNAEAHAIQGYICSLLAATSFAAANVWTKKISEQTPLGPSGREFTPITLLYYGLFSYVFVLIVFGMSSFIFIGEIPIYEAFKNDDVTVCLLCSLLFAACIALAANYLSSKAFFITKNVALISALDLTEIAVSTPIDLLRPTLALNEFQGLKGCGLIFIVVGAFWFTLRGTK